MGGRMNKRLSQPVTKLGALIAIGSATLCALAAGGVYVTQFTTADQQLKRQAAKAIYLNELENCTRLNDRVLAPVRDYLTQYAADPNTDPADLHFIQRAIARTSPVPCTAVVRPPVL